MDEETAMKAAYEQTIQADKLGRELIKEINTLISNKEDEWVELGISRMMFSQIMSSVWLNAFIIFRDSAFYAEMEKDTLLLIMSKIINAQFAKIEEYYGAQERDEQE
jgi:hypothetical protein